MTNETISSGVLYILSSFFQIPSNYSGFTTGRARCPSSSVKPRLHKDQGTPCSFDMGIRDMNIFDSLKSYAGSWQVMGKRSFNKEELTSIQECSLCNSDYGESVCFLLVSGVRKYIPVSRDADTSAGLPAREKMRLLTLKRGDETITRVEW